MVTAAIGQDPAAQRKHLLVRADGAGASHQLLDGLPKQNRVRAAGSTARRDARSPRSFARRSSGCPPRCGRPRHGLRRHHHHNRTTRFLETRHRAYARVEDRKQARGSSAPGLDLASRAKASG